MSSGPPLLPPPIAPPAPSPSAPSSTTPSSDDDAGSFAGAIVLLALLALLLLLCLDQYCRSRHGAGFFDRCIRCLWGETVAMITVHPNAVEMPAHYDMPKWRPWRPTPQQYQGGGTYV